MRVELVEDAVERVLDQGLKVGAEDIGQGGAADPIRHGMLGGGLDQPVEDHRAGELARTAGDTEVTQDVAETEPVPELIADMHGAGFAMLLGGDPARVDGDGAVVRRG
jgi:hypothetical protein